MGFFDKLSEKTIITEVKNSSVIKEIEYKPSTAILVVRFSNGKEAVYENIDEGLADEFASSDSKGKFYNQFIKMKKVVEEEKKNDEEDDNVLTGVS